MVLDTDHISVLQRREEPARSAMRSRMADVGREKCFLTIVSFHEQMLGWNAFLARAKRSEQLVHGYQMFGGLFEDYTSAPLLSFDEAAAAKLDDLLGRNLRVGAMDLRIAAIAIVHDMTLLTRNARDFERITDLRIDDGTRTHT